MRERRLQHNRRLPVACNPGANGCFPAHERQLPGRPGRSEWVIQRQTPANQAKTVRSVCRIASERLFGPNCSTKLALWSQRFSPISTVKLIGRRLGSGGFMSSRIAERMAVMASSWCWYLRSSSSSLRARVALEASSSRRRTKARTTKTLISTARGAVQDWGGHNGAVLGEGERREPRVPMLLGTGRNLRPVPGLGFGPGEPEHEIFRKPIGVALDLFVQPLGGDAVEGGQLGIQNDAVAAQDGD